MQTPSGYFFDNNELNLVRDMNRCGFLRFVEEPILQNSGLKTRIYVGGREDLTDNPYLEWMIGSKIASVIKKYAVEAGDHKTQCLIGIPTAGNVLAQAAAMVGARANNYRGFCHRTLRENLKEHGDGRSWVNGSYTPEQQSYWTVDNALTSGTSTFLALQKLTGSGYSLDGLRIFVLVDREQGGMECLINADLKEIVVCYKLSDLVHVLVELKSWPKTALQYMREEIRASVPF
jgi:orotate phosphoribosyltransferase